MATIHDRSWADPSPVSRIMRLPGAGEAAIGICAPTRVEVQRRIVQIHPIMGVPDGARDLREREEMSAILRSPEDLAPMTTIAFDGQQLAADTAVHDWEDGIGGGRLGSRSATVCKIYPLGNGWLFAATGASAECVLLQDALEGQIPDEKPSSRVIADLSEECPDGGMDIEAILVHHMHGAYNLEVTKMGAVVIYEQMAQHIALGSGAVVALAAMLAGASASKAVDIACDLSPGTGRPVMWYDIEDTENILSS